MKKAILVSLALVLAAWAPAGRAEEAKKPVLKTGGHFEVETIKDVAYVDGKDADPFKHKLDLYLPKGQKDYPVLFFVHGGSWRNGDRKRYEKLGPVFAQNGIGTVIISYRLTPAVQHPAHEQDVARAFAWTVRNIGKHGGRADQIVVCGHSAGGHLVALLATDESYLKAEKLTLADVKGVVAISGVYQVTPFGVMKAAFGDDPEVCKKASPLQYVKEGLPPFLLLYADSDFISLPTQAEQMGKALKDCNDEAETLKMADRSHISIIRGVADEDDPTTQAILGFFARHTGLKLTEKAAK
jgi:acetyl esterase/lipase